MRVLLVGAGGNIGSGVEAALNGHGHEVITVRHSKKGDIQADFSKPEDFRNRLTNVGFDAAICMLGMTVDHAQLMLSVCNDINAHLIWTSTVCVFGGPLPDGHADDTAPRRPISDYGRHKMAAEDYLLANADLIPTTIIRPASTGNESFPILRQLSVTNSWLDRVRAGKPVIAGGDGKQLWSWSTARDVGEAYALAVGDERAYGKAFTVTRPDPITWNEWHEGVAALMGKKIELVHLPAETILQSTLEHGLFEEQSRWDQAYSPRAFQQAFPEWEPRDTFESAITKALAHQPAKSATEIAAIARADAVEDALIEGKPSLGSLLRPDKVVARQGDRAPVAEW